MDIHRTRPKRAVMSLTRESLVPGAAHVVVGGPTGAALGECDVDCHRDDRIHHANKSDEAPERVHSGLELPTRLGDEGAAECDHAPEIKAPAAPSSP